MEKNDSEVSRRGFFEKALGYGLCGVAAAGLCVCVLSGCVKDDKTPKISQRYVEVKRDRVVVNVPKIKALRKVGGAAKIIHPEIKDRILVVKTANDRFLAVSSRCTHKGEALEYQHAKKRLRCVDFGKAVFGLDGRPIRGPAKKRLKVYRTLFLGGKLEVFL